MAENSVVGLDEVLQLLRDLPEHSFNTAKGVITTATLNTHSKVSSYSGGLKNRSGRLRRSLIFGVIGNTLNTLSGTVFTKSKYAPIQEEGGTITAQNKYLNVPGGPYLNIPLASNKTAAGVMRQNAREVFSSGGYIIKSTAGKYLVMSGTGEPMFVLVKQVVIPARLGMQEAADSEVPILLSTLKNKLLRGL